MAPIIEIKLFDGFGIYKNGEQILAGLSNTRKTKLFVAYLLTNRDRSISHQELFELLWSGEEYANPATALRTLLYRFRSMIDSEGAEALSGAIISRRGTYQWNKNLDISIDVLDFVALSEQGLDIARTDAEREKYLKKAIDMYKGSLLPDFCSEPWLISKAAAYRDKYIEDVESYIAILKNSKRYIEIVELCEQAQNLAGASELLELENKMARLCIANSNPASRISDASESYYKQFKQLSDFLKSETDRIQNELEDDAVEQKAYLCDYRTFKEIYRLQRRFQSRSKATIFLGLIDVRIDGSEQSQDDGNTVEDIMYSIVDCCQRQLRCGDAICRISDMQIAILFPAESYEDAMGVLERLKTASKERTDEDLLIAYRVRPLKNARE